MTFLTCAKKCQATVASADYEASEALKSNRWGRGNRGELANIVIVQARSLARRRGAGVLSAISISFIAALVAALGERPIRRYLASSSRKCQLLVSAALSPLRRRMRVPRAILGC